MAKHDKLLIRCLNSLYADEVTDALLEQDIDSRQQFESKDSKNRGPLDEVDIFVSGDDYDRASDILSEIGSTRNTKSIVFCPTCDSQKVSRITPYAKYRKIMRITGHVCIILCICIFIFKQALVKDSTPMIFLLTSLMVIGGILLHFSKKEYCQANYKCRKCRRRFYW